MHRIENNDTACAAPVTDNETARLLELCANQIAAAVHEAFREIDALSDAVLNTARHAGALLDAGSDIRTKASRTEDRLQADAQALQQAVQNAISRMQFADRLNQRLSNVSSNLAGLATLMKSTELPTTDNQWRGYLKRTRATFTMEQERGMFDEMFSASATDASPGSIEVDGNSTNEG